MVSGCVLIIAAHAIAAAGASQQCTASSDCDADHFCTPNLPDNPFGLPVNQCAPRLKWLDDCNGWDACMQGYMCKYSVTLNKDKCVKETIKETLQRCTDDSDCDADNSCMTEGGNPWRFPSKHCAQLSRNRSLGDQCVAGWDVCMQASECKQLGFDQYGYRCVKKCSTSTDCGADEFCPSRDELTFLPAGFCVKRAEDGFLCDAFAEESSEYDRDEDGFGQRRMVEGCKEGSVCNLAKKCASDEDCGGHHFLPSQSSCLASHWGGHCAYMCEPAVDHFVARNRSVGDQCVPDSDVCMQGSECKQLGFDNYGYRCAKKCTASTDCGADEFCPSRDEMPYLPAGFCVKRAEDGFLCDAFAKESSEYDRDKDGSGQRRMVEGCKEGSVCNVQKKCASDEDCNGRGHRFLPSQSSCWGAGAHWVGHCASMCEPAVVHFVV